MYCEKYKCSMNESVCIARYGWHFKTRAQKRRLPPYLNDPGCAKCAQGEELYKQSKLKEKDMADENTQLKICAKCKKELPADPEHFYKDTKSKDGLGSWCRACQKESAGAVKKKIKGEKQKVQKKTAPAKQDAELFFSGAAKLDKGNIIVLDFSEHEDLLADINTAAEEFFRTPKMQILWWLTTREDPNYPE